jgi:hypothetical protein
LITRQGVNRYAQTSEKIALSKLFLEAGEAVALIFTEVDRASRCTEGLRLSPSRHP